MNGLTIDEAIEALKRIRVRMGGAAPLLMADGLPVFSFGVVDDSVYVSDSEPERPLVGLFRP